MRPICPMSNSGVLRTRAVARSRTMRTISLARAEARSSDESGGTAEPCSRPQGPEQAPSGSPSGFSAPSPRASARGRDGDAAAQVAIRETCSVSPRAPAGRWQASWRLLKPARRRRRHGCAPERGWCVPGHGSEVRESRSHPGAMRPGPLVGTMVVATESGRAKTPNGDAGLLRFSRGYERLEGRTPGRGRRGLGAIETSSQNAGTGNEHRMNHASPPLWLALNEGADTPTRTQCQPRMRQADAPRMILLPQRHRWFP